MFRYCGRANATAGPRKRGTIKLYKQKRRMNLFLSCEKVAELLSRSLDEPLGMIDRLRLKHHLLFCGDCRNVDEQLKQLNGLMHSPFELGDVVDQSSNLAAK